MKIQGIHHVSAIVWHPQENIDFYASVLGLKLLKRTLNFDDPNVYHFYYGNDEAELGTVVTYFPWKKHHKEGIIGEGQVGITSLSIPMGSMPFWEDRLNQFGVHFEVLKRFDETYLRFQDPHGVFVELVETELGRNSKHEYNGVTSDVAIKGIYSVVLFSSNPEKTLEFLENVFELRLKSVTTNFYRFEMDQTFGKFIDVIKIPMNESKEGAGTYHHVAFTVNNDEIEQWKHKLINLGFTVTKVKERHFFKSIYFREPGGIIFEIATNKPGFEADLEYKSKPDLFIPPQYKDLSDEVLKSLIPVEIKEITKLSQYPYQNEAEYLIWKDHQDLLARINYLAKESKIRTLTDDEKEEQFRLRKIYINNLKDAIRTSMTSVRIEDEDGDFKEIKRKDLKKYDDA